MSLSYYQQLRLDRRAAGLCTSCGGATDGQLATCDECRRKRKARGNKRSNNPPPSPFPSLSAAQNFAADNHLQPWEAVRVLMFYREDYLVSTSRIQAIGRKAEAKLALLLADLYEELGAA